MAFCGHSLNAGETGAPPPPTAQGGCSRPGQSPAPFLHEGVKLNQGKPGGGKRSDRMPGRLPLYSSGMVSPSCWRLRVSRTSSQVRPRMAFPWAPGASLLSPPQPPPSPGQVAWYLRSIPWILKTAGMRESHKKQTENKTLKMKQTVKLKCSVPDAVALDSCVEVNRDHPLGKTQDKTKQNKKPRKPQPVYSR